MLVGLNAKTGVSLAIFLVLSVVLFKYAGYISQNLVNSNFYLQLSGNYKYRNVSINEVVVFQVSDQKKLSIINKFWECSNQKIERTFFIEGSGGFYVPAYLFILYNKKCRFFGDDVEKFRKNIKFSDLDNLQKKIISIPDPAFFSLYTNYLNKKSGTNDTYPIFISKSGVLFCIERNWNSVLSDVVRDGKDYNVLKNDCIKQTRLDAR